MTRPSHKELFGKIKVAKKAVSEGRIKLINQESLSSDADELGYLLEDELQSILSELLDKSKPEHYVGMKPPQKSYEKEIKGLELFAFKVESDFLDHNIYYKFTIQDDKFYLVSLHKHREEES
jgi:hypothetical protein